MTIESSSLVNSKLNLVSGFLRSAESFPTYAAVEDGGRAVSYEELRERAGRVCSALATADAGESKLTAILGSRSTGTFSGILGALMRGNGYVPLGLDYPVARNAEMIARSRARTLVVDRSGL